MGCVVVGLRDAGRWRRAISGYEELSLVGWMMGVGRLGFMTFNGEVGRIHNAWRSGEMIVGGGVEAEIRVSRMDWWYESR